MWPFKHKKTADELDAEAASSALASSEYFESPYVEFYSPEQSHSGYVDLAYTGFLCRGSWFTAITEVVEKMMWGKVGTWKVSMYSGNIVLYFSNVVGKQLNDILYRVRWYIDYWNRSES